MRTNKILVVPILIAVTGCIKTGTKEIIMPDQQIKGNQGFLIGTPPKVEQPQTPKKKKILDIEVELPPIFEKVPSKYTEDKEIWGNAGYIYTGKEEKMKYIYVPIKTRKTTKIKQVQPRPEVKKQQVVSKQKKQVKEKKTLPEIQPRFIEYKVRKGESLWTIAKKVYGDATKWTVIYENNRDILSDPEKIRPGMVLKIPMSEEVNTEYIK